MGRWFRVHDDLVDDPKVQLLSGDLVKALLNLWCLASQNDGVLPSMKDVAFKLRMKPQQLAAVIAELSTAGLIDREGDEFRPHNWDKRQYKTDNSSERVSKYREKRKAAGLPVLSDYSIYRPTLIKRDGERCVYCPSTEKLVVDHMVPIALGGTDDTDNLALACKACNGGKAGRTPELAKMTIAVTSAALALARYRDKCAPVTVTVTPPEYRDRDRIQNTETEKKDPPLRSDDWPKDFGDVFWAAYPRKTEKLSAMKKLATIRKSGIVTFADLMAGVRRYAASGTDPQYTKHPTTWLNAGCWSDETQIGGGHGQRTTNSGKARSDAILAAASREARKIIGDGEVAGAAGEAELSFGDGPFGGATRGHHGSAGATSAGDDRRKPFDGAVLEGEVIAPDEANAGLPGGWRVIG